MLLAYEEAIALAFVVLRERGGSGCDAGGCGSADDCSDDLAENFHLEKLLKENLTNLDWSLFRKDGNSP